MLTQLFSVDGTTHGPYAALPVSGSWLPDDCISVDRVTAGRIVCDLNTLDADCGIAGVWMGDDLAFLVEDGAHRVCPDADGRYSIGGLWAWKKLAI
ncbi:hypothetical protein [Streptomyces sp. Isolate_45]|uniref:hypothetical protein n=1 Tax=Streptomyces sp. Isolate_45 TaxID=2950111 RepID=UPI002481C518|nr:hypothetical protein [Streptomyces sp. Isolate_45]MDA5279872.1 hypothetical protein [Streptomyces sp. Isolate_45]